MAESDPFTRASAALLQQALEAVGFHVYETHWRPTDAVGLCAVRACFSWLVTVRGVEVHVTDCESFIGPYESDGFTGTLEQPDAAEAIAARMWRSSR